LHAGGGSLEIKKIPEFCSLPAAEIGANLRWLIKREWVEKNKNVLTLTQKGKSALTGKDDDERLLEILAAKERIRLDEIDGLGISSQKCTEFLKTREGIVAFRDRRDKISWIERIRAQNNRWRDAPRLPVFSAHE